MSTSETETPDTDVAETSGEETKTRLTLEVKVDKPSTCKRHITVTIAREDVDRYIGEAYEEIIPKAAIPGFRPGRAPRKLVESRFKEQVHEQVKGTLLMDSLTQINEDHEFTAISEPDFDIGAVLIPDDGPLTFEFDLEVRPEFDLPQWKGLKLERPVHEYSTEEVSEQLKRLLERFGTIVPKDGPVALEDIVQVNVTCTYNDKVVATGREMEIRVRPVLSLHDGSVSDFGKLMVGAKAGETKTTKVTVSDDSENEELRGKEVTIAFEILDVKQTETPELNRQFLDRIGGFETEEAVRDAVKEELDRQLSYHQQRRIREQITLQLIAGANWELPNDMLRRQSVRELQRAVMELQRAGFSDDEINSHANQLRQNTLSSTARALKEHFILERLAEEETIEALPADYDDEIKLIAEQRDESPRRVRARFEKRGLMDTLRNQIVERKVIELITDNATFTEVPFTPKVNDTVAVEFTISGKQGGEDQIPEAKHGGGADEPLPGQSERR